jgi:ATP-dependent DNA ligase
MLRAAAFIEPCLPSPADKPPSGSNWIHEIKHDGYRLMARRDPVGIRLITRRGNDWTTRYPLVVEAVNHLKVRSCLIDGEVVCCDERGLAIFSTLRQRRNEARAFLFAFDLLELDGLDMRREPIETRKATLASPPTQGQAWGASERAHSASQRRRRVSSRLQAGCRGNCVEAPRLALQVGPFAGLAQVQEPRGACGETRGGRGLG